MSGEPQSKGEKTRLYLTGKFLEFFFGLQPSTWVLVGLGFLLYFAILAVSIALGVVLIDKTQTQLELVNFTVTTAKPNSATSNFGFALCNFSWIKATTYNTNGRGLQRKQCGDPFWDDLLSSNASLLANVWAAGTFSISDTLGDCESTEIVRSFYNPALIAYGIGFPTFTQSRSRSESLFYYNNSNCSSSSLAFSLSLRSCNMVDIDDPETPGFPATLRVVCPATIVDSPNLDLLNAFFSDSADGPYLCSATVDPYQLLQVCVQNSTYSDTIPANQIPISFSFTSSDQLFPSMLAVARQSSFTSTLVTTALATGIELLRCADTSLIMGNNGPYSQTTSADSFNISCAVTAEVFCNRLCYLSMTLQPWKLNPRVYSQYTPPSYDIAQCIAMCSVYTPQEFRDLLYFLNLDRDMETIYVWIYQAIVRCTTPPTVEPGTSNINAIAAETLSVTCLTQAQVPVSNYQVSQFVNVISWIGTFQLTSASFLVAFYILKSISK